jgi:hypothetical protein
MNAATDHSSVLFNVDMSTGVIGEGCTNYHWYQLGIDKVLNTPWLPTCSHTNHPDPPQPLATGQTVPGMKEALDIVIRFIDRFVYTPVCDSIHLCLLLIGRILR